MAPDFHQAGEHILWAHLVFCRDSVSKKEIKTVWAFIGEKGKCAKRVSGAKVEPAVSLVARALTQRKVGRKEIKKFLFWSLRLAISRSNRGILS